MTNTGARTGDDAARRGLPLRRWSMRLALPGTDPDRARRGRSTSSWTRLRNDRRAVADAAAPLPVPELHHRRATGPRREHGFTESWPERLERIGPRPASAWPPLSASTTGRRKRSWRKPSRSSGRVLPDANLLISHPEHRRPRRPGGSCFGSGLDPRHLARRARRRDRLRHRRCARVGAMRPVPRPVADPGAVEKGSRFDLVVLIDPEATGDGHRGRSTAMSR